MYFLPVAVVKIDISDTEWLAIYSIKLGVLFRLLHRFAFPMIIIHDDNIHHCLASAS
jgi:hypothetical protein